MNLKELLCLLEERLVEHDNNRRKVQSELQEECSKLIGEADSLEERISVELQSSFSQKEERILSFIKKLSSKKKGGNDDLDDLIKQAMEELSEVQLYKIKHSKESVNFAESYNLKVAKPKSDFTNDGDHDSESIIKELQSYLSMLSESKTSALNKLAKVCTKRRNDAEEMKNSINEKLEEFFSQEDARLQKYVNLIKEKINDDKSSEEENELTTKYKKKLFINKKYVLKKPTEEGNLLDEYDLAVINEISLKFIDFEERKPTNITVSFIKKEDFSLSFDFFSNDELKLLRTATDLSFKAIVKIWEKGCVEEDSIKKLVQDYIVEDQQVYLSHLFNPSAVYCVKARIECSNGLRTQWSDIAEFTSPEFKDLCGWKKCPKKVDRSNKYSIDEDNPRIAKKASNAYCHCTVIGDTPLPFNKVISWNIKILKSEKNDGKEIWIGVAPFDIDQSEDGNFVECGWYFYCYESYLHSGLPHRYDRRSNKEYGPRKRIGKYVRTGNSVGVVMDTTKGELSFVVKGVNYGVAFEGIPLDKPLVPCVILEYGDDSVEISDINENAYEVVTSIPVPSSITAKSCVTWSSITLTWDDIEDAFYQIEVDGNKLYEFSSTNSFIKSGFIPDTEHTFRVRTVKDNSLSEWSEVVKGRTQKESFGKSGWKECPDHINRDRKYLIDVKNPRIATKVDYLYYGTIIGNTPLPLNKVNSWKIKILKSCKNDGDDIYVGVAPCDINQNKDDNHKECGWYLDCRDSTLYSGPPHNYGDKEYGPRKEEGGHIHNGGVVGVVMDTTKGELSFVLKRTKLGVAYEGIPLDKPLVPCVLLVFKDDSVELDIPREEEAKVDSSIPVPSNVIVKVATCNLITFSWDAVEGASLYQVEVDGNVTNVYITNSFTQKGLLPETEHSFRVLVVKGNTMSEWSDVVKGRTLGNSFEVSCLKEYPSYIDEEHRYKVDENNLRIATNTGIKFCTIIGNAPLPLKKVVSWSIKILKSKGNDGKGICVGVAPFDIDQCYGFNYSKSGWYLNCFFSELLSGPPHNYDSLVNKKDYGTKKSMGKYVKTGSIIGVVMDTTKGELSFALKRTKLGVAYEGIPLDKPLVPCVLIRWNGDSIEFDPSYKPK